MDTTDSKFVIRRRQSRRPVGQRVGGGKKIADNYLAQAQKRPVGAPLGNRNARTHGLRSADKGARAAALDALLKKAEALAAAVEAAVEEGRAMRARLRAPPPGAPRPPAERRS